MMASTHARHAAKFSRGRGLKLAQLGGKTAELATPNRRPAADTVRRQGRRRWRRRCGRSSRAGRRPVGRPAAVAGRRHGAASRQRRQSISGCGVRRRRLLRLVLDGMTGGATVLPPGDCMFTTRHDTQLQQHTTSLAMSPSLSLLTNHLLRSFISLKYSCFQDSNQFSVFRIISKLQQIATLRISNSHQPRGTHSFENSN